MGLLGKIFGKKKPPIELPAIDIKELVAVDMHGHFLFGIDDGAKTEVDAVNMLKGMEELGYEKVFCTPHVMFDFYKNSSATILEKLTELKQVIKKHNIKLELHASAEYYFDEELNKRLSEGDILHFGGKKFLLFEFSYFNEHQGVQQLLNSIFSKGYTPILAHPERYPYFAQDLTKYDDLKEKGVLFQVNLMSLIGHYGDSAVHASEYLIEKGFVDFIATDLHRPEHLEKIKKALCSERLHNLISKNNLLNKSLLD